MYAKLSPPLTVVAYTPISDKQSMSERACHVVYSSFVYPVSQEASELLSTFRESLESARCHSATGKDTEGECNGFRINLVLEVVLLGIHTSKVESK